MELRWIFASILANMAFPHFYNPDLHTQHPPPSSQFLDNYKQLSAIKWPSYPPTQMDIGHWTLDIKLDKIATMDPTVRMNMPPPWKLSSAAFSSTKMSAFVDRLNLHGKWTPMTLKKWNQMAKSQTANL